MNYQIDQSGKIEDTAKPTILAACNHVTYAILIPAKTKRQFQETCRREGLTRLYIYILFALGVSMLLSELTDLSSVTIDTEYPGKEKLIKDLIEIFMKKLKTDVNFARIGNKPKVHYAAHDVYIKKKRADKIISLQEVMRTIKKTDGRLRECLSTLVGARPRSIKKVYTKTMRKSRRKI